MPRLKQQYIDSGQVRFVYRDFLVPSHPSALLAAVASRCAGQQGQFWPMHDLLFETHQVEWGGVPNRDRPVMLDFAGQLGLEPVAFEACMADPAIEQAVREEAEAARHISVTGTPTFIINNLLLVGAQSFEVFQQAIQQAADEAR